MRTKLVLGVGAVVLLIVAAGLLQGFVPSFIRGSRETARPACGALPSRAEVDKAIVSHAELVAQIRAVGTSVTVETEQPCDTPRDRALVLVTYSGNDQYEHIDSILTKSAGFGVPVQLREE
jgi:hypothetical protein